MSATASWEWKQLVAGALQEAKIIPLWGNPPSFPWEDLGKALAEKWNLPDLQINCLKTSWEKKPEALRGLGTRPVVIPIDVSPLDEGCYWGISSEDMQLLSQAVLQPPDFKDLMELVLARGCFQFLLLQALQIFSENKTYPILRAQVAEERPLPDTAFLVCEIAVQWTTGRICGKLLLPRPFLGFLRDLYRVEPTEFIHSPAARSLSVPLHLVVGRSTLPLSQWKLASEGDFLRLEACTLSPNRRSGRARLMLNDTPLFDLAIKKGKVSLLDYAFYQGDTMKDDDYDEGENVEEGDEKFEEEEIEEEEIFEEEVEEEEGPEKEEEEEEEEVEEEAAEEAEEDEESGEPRDHADSEKLAHIITSGEIPITLVVEIGRLQMNLDKVLELQPGNVLDLAQPIDTNVRISSGGKCVAAGELVALGETVGVKITKIGS